MPQSVVQNMARPMRCSCDDSHLGQPPRNTVASYELQFVQGLVEKAQIWPGTGRIQIDQRFWSTLSKAQQTAVLAHELAHDEDPSACEKCADARAGARMRYEGLSAQLAVASLESVVGHRRTSGSVLYGWQVADAAIAAGGNNASAAFVNEPGDVTKNPNDEGPRYVRPTTVGAASLDDDGISIGSPFGAEVGDVDNGQSIGTVDNRAAGGASSPVITVTDGRTLGKPGVVGHPPATSTTTPPPSSTLTPSVGKVLVLAGAVIVVVILVRTLRKGA
jgi:hypothetical protein